MRSYREELWFNTPTRVAFVRITDQVAAAVRKSGVREGLCLVNAMHITASVFVNDNRVCGTTSSAGWKNSRRTRRCRSIATTTPAKTTPTRT